MEDYRRHYSSGGGCILDCTQRRTSTAYCFSSRDYGSRITIVFTIVVFAEHRSDATFATKVKWAFTTIKRIRFALAVVDPKSTYPEPAAVVLAQAQRHFPTLPIILVSPRVNGFSRTYATFDIDRIAPHINADKIRWRKFPPGAVADPELPF